MTDRYGRLDSLSHEYLDVPPDRDVDVQIGGYLAEDLIPRLRGASVCEMGVGDRAWTKKLLKRFSKVTTLEGSAEIIRRAREEILDAHWIPVHTLFEEYDPARGFDVVVSSFVLEHVEDPATVLTRIHDSWLVRGGQLLVVVPHALSLHRRLAVSMGLAGHPSELGEADRRLGHHHCFSWYEVISLLVEAGFTVREKMGFFLKPLPNAVLQHCSKGQIAGLFALGREVAIDYAATIAFLAERDEQ